MGKRRSHVIRNFFRKLFGFKPVEKKPRYPPPAEQIAQIRRNSAPQMDREWDINRLKHAGHTPHPAALKEMIAMEEVAALRRNSV